MEAAGGGEALRLLRAGRIAHVVLSCIDLQNAPEGARLAEAVRREFPHIKLLQGAPEANGQKPARRGTIRTSTDLPEVEDAIRDALTDRTPNN